MRSMQQLELGTANLLLQALVNQLDKIKILFNLITLLQNSTRHS